MSVTVKVGGQLFTVKSTDDPEIAKKKARRELRKQSGETLKNKSGGEK